MWRLSTRLYRSMLSTPNPLHHHRHFPLHFSTTNFLADSDSHESPLPDSPPPPDSTQHQLPPYFERPLEKGIDVGIYRAILVGKAGQKPVQKTLKSGTVVTLMSLGTGGIRNNRRPLDHESPTEYANRCAVQWHRVSIYPQRLGSLAMKHVLTGSILYVEGNLETKIFSDPVTGIVRRVREVAVRQNGRVVFISRGDDANQQKERYEPKSVGYY